MWNKVYGGGAFDGVFALVETFDGGFTLAGFTESFGAGNSDLWLIRTDEYGIPDAPSWIILPVFLITTLIITIYRKHVNRSKD